MKSAAIIGYNGMLGRTLARHLRARDVAVLSIGRAVHHEVVLDLAEPLNQDVCHGRQAEVIFHCAASFAADDATGLRTNLQTNAVASTNVLTLLEQLGADRCVYAGSMLSFAFADSAGLSSYGLSKALGEQVLEWGLSRRGGTFCSLRLPQLYDTEGRCCTHQPWFGRIIAYASRGVDLHLPPSTGPRNFVHVDDAARLMIRAAETGLAGVWPMSHPESLDSTQIAELAYKTFGQGGQVIVDHTKQPFRAFHFAHDPQLFSLLDDTPSISMAEGIAMIRREGHAHQFGPLDVQ